METVAGKGDPGPQRSNVLVLLEAECSKVPRVEDQVDVHTRLPLLEAKQEKQQPKVMYEKLPTNLMEVFSVKFLEFDETKLSQMYGCRLIGSYPTYVVFSRKDGEPLNIDSEGFIKLRGPDTIIVPNDSIEVYPFLYRYNAGADQFKDDESELLWNLLLYCYFDTIMSRSVRCQFGQIEVNYAVYRHGVVAHVDITLTGFQCSSATVGGLITAQNSKLGENGKSFLFKTDKNEGISINVSPCKDRIAQLPLVRCKTAVPVNSSLKVYVNIWHCSINSAQDDAIVLNEEFEYVARLSGREVSTFRGAACQVNVGITWFHYES